MCGQTTQNNRNWEEKLAEKFTKPKNNKQKIEFFMETKKQKMHLGLKKQKLPKRKKCDLLYRKNKTWQTKI